MPLSPTLVWEVRASGSDANSGGFRAGASGTDYSQADTPLIAFTDLAIDATDAAKVTSAQVGFTAAHVGNTLNLTASTGITAGVYEIKAVASGVATLDRTAGTVGATGGSGRLGGARGSLDGLASVLVASNLVWVRAGLYNLNNGLTLTLPDTIPGPATPPARLFGYTTTRGDITLETVNPDRPRLRLGSGKNLFLNGYGWSLAYLDIAPQDGLKAATLLRPSRYSNIQGCKLTGPAVLGISTNGGSTLIRRCEVTGDFDTAGINVTASSTVRACTVRDGAMGTGILVAGSAQLAERNVIARISGGPGLALGAGSRAYHNTIHGGGSHGILLTDHDFTTEILGNLLTSNGGYGLACTPTGTPPTPQFDGNAYFGNTSGSRQNLDDTGTASPINAALAYANTRDLTLTASPYVNATANDFRLNTTTGGGTACRGTAPDPAWPGLGIAGALDMGAVQHQDVGGGSHIISWLEG